MNRLRPVHILLSVAPLLAGPFVGFAGGQAAPPVGRPAALLSPAEFPDYDAEVWRAQRDGLAAAWSSSRLTRLPENQNLAELLQQNRVDDALRVLRSIVDTYPQIIPGAFEIVSTHSARFADRARGYPDALQELVDAARRQLPRLPREEAARAERQLLLVDTRPSVSPVTRPPFADQLRAFVKEYAGTETALLTEIDVMVFGLPIRDRLAALDRFIRDHPGTIAAAKALHQKGFQLGSGNVYPEIEARGADPTARFFQVLEIVEELESGRYPPCEWVDGAPTLVSTFFAASPTYAPGNIDRLLDAYKGFAKTHFAVADQYPLSTGTGYIVTTKMLDLFQRTGEGVAGVERVFTELEQDIPDGAAVQYLRALFYVQSMNREPAADRPAYYRKAIESLTRLQAQGTGLYHRKALATLASLYLSEGHYASARDHFRKYVTAYPRTAWAWVAALRIGQASAELGDWSAAVDAHRTAASTYTAVPLARVLGHAYAARGYEALGQFTAALREYQAALAGWNMDYGPRYSLHVTRNVTAHDTGFIRDRKDVSVVSLPVRIAQLEHSLGVAGGALLERGRWLVEHGRYRDALVPLEQLLTRHGRSAAVPEARYLAHRARLGIALDLASPSRDDAAALAELEGIDTVPYDFGVCAARIARASLLWRRGTVVEADSLMLAALNEWHAHQAAQREAPRGSLERDVADIRALVIGPSGDEVLSGRARQTFARGRASAPFVVLNPDVLILWRDGRQSRLTVYHSLPGAGRVLFLTSDQQAVLSHIVAKVGGRREPDPPTGLDILTLWHRFFPAERRVGGPVAGPQMIFETAPVITEVEFLDAGRTRAAARVVVGNSGGTILLEKRHGIWTATALVNTWIA